MKYYFFAILTLIVFSGLACKKSMNINQDPEEENPGDSLATPGKEVLVWIDANANIFNAYGRFNDKDEIKIILDSLKTVGVTGIVVDVKHSTGYTLYPSAHTKLQSTYNGQNLPENYVQFMVDQAKERSLDVYLSINTFVGGNTSTMTGTVYDDPGFRERNESIVCDVNGNRVPVSSTGSNSFLNPASEEVQDGALEIIREIASKFDIDGIILDYCRYRGINADFSDESKRQFIEFLEEKYQDNDAKSMEFPKDIISSWKLNGSAVVPAATGKYYKKWLYYRASVLREFMEKAKAAVKGTKAGVQLGAYVGGWYSTYYEVGVNWGSETYDPFNDEELRFSWAYPGYQETGYAEQIDLLMTGNYFKQLMLADNPATAHLYYHWWSVEGSINGAQHVTQNKVKHYGSLDIGNTAYDNKQQISDAMKYVLSRTSGGLMLFDVVHIYAARYNRLKEPLWDAVEEGLKDN